HHDEHSDDPHPPVYVFRTLVLVKRVLVAALSCFYPLLMGKFRVVRFRRDFRHESYLSFPSTSCVYPSRSPAFGWDGGCVLSVSAKGTRVLPQQGSGKGTTQSSG